MSEQEEAINFVITKTLEEVMNGDLSIHQINSVGDDIWKLNLTSLSIVKYITALQKNTGISDIDIVDVIKNNIISSKNKTVAYLINKQVQEMVNGSV